MGPECGRSQKPNIDAAIGKSDGRIVAASDSRSLIADKVIE
jgi:hypothetical protein